MIADRWLETDIHVGSKLSWAARHQHRPYTIGNPSWVKERQNVTWRQSLMKRLNNLYEHYDTSLFVLAIEQRLDNVADQHRHVKWLPETWIQDRTSTFFRKRVLFRRYTCTIQPYRIRFLSRNDSLISENLVKDPIPLMRLFCVSSSIIPDGEMFEMYTIHAHLGNSLHWAVGDFHVFSIQDLFFSISLYYSKMKVR